MWLVKILPTVNDRELTASLILGTYFPVFTLQQFGIFGSLEKVSE